MTARALAPLAVLAEYAAPLLREGGVLVAWKGRATPTRSARGAAAAASWAWSRGGASGCEPFEGARDRHLHVLHEGRPDAGRASRAGRGWRASARWRETTQSPGRQA